MCMLMEQYKTSLSKQEARAWKRPPIHFPVGVPITFSKLRSNPSAAGSSRKKLISDPSERFKTTKDLTLAEKGPYILLEFSVRLDFSLPVNLTESQRNS